MAEIGTVLAIIQIADRIVGLCRYWIGAVRDAPSDLRSILLETSMLKTVLENVDFLTTQNDNSSTALSSLSQPDGPVQHCYKILIDLVDLLPSEGVNLSLGVKARLAWPLRETKARKLLSELGRYKTAITLALTTDSAHDIKDIRTKTTHMSEMLTDRQRDECCQWLQRTDPSPLHNRAQSQIEQGTCQWMLRSSEWADWLAGRHRCLWIHGIPGAGKTVLASYLIEQVKSFCLKNDGSKRAVLYYYCYYGHNQDEAAPLLRWLSSQLCRKSRAVPDYILGLFRERCEPSLPELLNALAATLEHFETVYLVVDAVDESMPRIGLLKVLRDITSDPRFGKLQLLATSREYIDIERVWEEISIPISMSNSYIADDIRRYIQSTISEHHRFKRWPKFLLDEVQDTLCSRAKGMFRWVVCQLDRLQRMKYEPRIIKNALATLPRTLDETYDRIFLEISEEERPLVRQCLKWIEFHNEVYKRNIPLTVLLQALDYVDKEPDEATSIHHFDEEYLREICGCLINISPGNAFPRHYGQDIDSVSFAHYTVREFLVSDRIGTSKAAYFILGDRHQLEILMIIFLTALGFEQPDLGDRNDDSTAFKALCNHFPSYCAISAVFSISVLPHILVNETDLTSLVFRFLDPFAGTFQSILTFIRVCQDDFGLASEAFNSIFDFWTLQWNMAPSPETANAMLLFSILILADNTEDLAVVFLKDVEGTMELALLRLQFTMDLFDHDSQNHMSCDFDGSVLEFFCQDYGTAGYVGFILDRINHIPSSTFVLQSHDWSYTYGWKGARQNEYHLKRLLALGADPNSYEYTITPLQIATAELDYEYAKVLLDAGADPNWIGNPAGIRPPLPFRDCKVLEGLRPLYICENKVDEEWAEAWMAPKETAEKRGIMEALLKERGAKSFVSAASYKCELRYILNT